MMELLLDLASWGFILLGLFFMVVGTLGVLRMPDIYTRLHAAGMTDTMGAGFMILGMCLQAGLSLLTLRLALVYLFLLFTSPIGTHATARAALRGGVEPLRIPVERE
jgi:multicomponent Na+:H+ antiporter subunit G